MYKEGVLGGFSFRGYICLVSNRLLSASEGITLTVRYLTMDSSNPNVNSRK